MSRDPKRRDVSPGDGYPTPFTWVDLPTVRLDDAGRAAAARHIREGRMQPVRDFEAS